MLNSKLTVEKFLQKQRFRKVFPYLKGHVLDFGGNKGELAQFVKGSYSLINEDYSLLEQPVEFDLIVALAVIEHIETSVVNELFRKFKKVLKKSGSIIITTPAPKSKPVLEILAFAGLLDRENIKEHKHYWKEKELFNLASSTGFIISNYRKFQFGLNQFARFVHKS